MNEVPQRMITSGRGAAPLRTALTVLAGLLALGVLPGLVEAQDQGQITGQVLNAQSGQPVQNAQVLVPGTGIGTLTGRQGRYLLLSVPAGEVTVQVQSIGFATAEETVTLGSGESITLDFQLRSQAISLDEVVVTGTAAQTSKRKMGNSISTLNVTEDIETKPISQMSDLLRGRMPGVQSNISSGTIGTSGVIQVRGITSLTLDQDPVIYVDGVRMDAGFRRTSDWDDASMLGGQHISRMTDLQPSDIERIEVVKGAAAATMYGTQGSNGVIQIFTKRGRVGEPQFTFEVEQGFERTPTDTFPGSNYPDFVNPATGFRAVDPIHEVGNGYHARYDLSVRGGTEDLQYYASAGWKQEEASIRPAANWIHQFSGRTNLDAQLTDNLSMAVNSGLVNSTLRIPRGDNALEGIYSHMASGVPFTATEDRPYGERFGNVDAHTYEMEIFQRVLRNTTGLQLEHVPGEDFRQVLNVGIDWFDEETTRYFQFGYTGSGHSEGDKTNSQRNNRNVTVDYRATLSSAVSDIITSDLSAGVQGNFTNTVFTNAIGEDFPAPGVSTVNATSRTFGDEVRIEEVNAGIFAEETIGLWDRLFVTGGLRLDGNSAFGNEFNSQLYPKASVAYNISEEQFWPSDLISPLKLRFAYGTSGVAPAQFAADRTYSPIGTQGGLPGVTPGNIGNPDLGPEKSQEFEVGFDAGFFDERMGLVFTAYHQRTLDALLNRPFPPSQGFLSSQLTNIGEVMNQGLEIGVNGLIVEERNLQWRASATFSAQESEVVDMGGVAPFNTGFVRVVEGYPINSIWGYDMAEWDPETRTHTRTDEQFFWGQSDPKWFGSFSTTVNWNRFMFSGMADYQGGHHKVNFAEWWNIRVESGDEYLELLEKPHGGRTAASDSLLDYAQTIGSRAPKFIHPADFLALRELAVGYRLPEGFFTRFGLEDSMIRASVRNVWMWDKWNGINPETERRGAQGLGHGGDWSTVPPSRIFKLLFRTSF